MMHLYDVKPNLTKFGRAGFSWEVDGQLGALPVQAVHFFRPSFRPLGLVVGRAELRFGARGVMPLPCLRPRCRHFQGTPPPHRIMKESTGSKGCQRQNNRTALGAQPISSLLLVVCLPEHLDLPRRVSRKTILIKIWSMGRGIENGLGLAAQIVGKPIL